MIVILIPAAGASARMRGRDKLLEEIEGEPVLRRQVRAAQATGWPVVVCLRSDRPERRAALAELDVELIEVPDPETGMAASIRAGMSAVADEYRGVMILPADMPDLKTEHFQILEECFEGKPNVIWRGASEDGRQGHPVLFPALHFSALRQLPDGDGARDVMTGQNVQLCPLPGQAAVTDLDTPEEWARWRAARSEVAQGR
jgi:CTP:molybdopterin cytidylyltransferase MocA